MIYIYRFTTVSAEADLVESESQPTPAFRSLIYCLLWPLIPFRVSPRVYFAYITDEAGYTKAGISPIDVETGKNAGTCVSTLSSELRPPIWVPFTSELLVKVIRSESLESLKIGEGTLLWYLSIASLSL